MLLILDVLNKRTLITICTIFIFAVLRAQGEATYWYFGENAGLDFSSGAPQLNLDGQLSTNEGCGTISDANGQLLFYTDGISVWDRGHNQMPNGFGLLGDPSSTQSGVIIPRPGFSNLYFIFTVDNSAGDNGFRYSVVDMNLNNGFGDITSEKNIELATPTTEKITAVKHANGFDYWVVTHEWNSNNFLAYQITSLGINENPVVSSVGTFHGNLNTAEINASIANTIGYLKISPNGKRLVSAKFGGENSNVELFNFDDISGVVSNPILIENYFYEASADSGAYGVEFSPDGNILYVTDNDFDFNLNIPSTRLHQFDIRLSNAEDIINSATVLYDGNDKLGALQLAIDGKIYVSNDDKTALDVINNPNVLGLGSHYQSGVVDLGGRSAALGLPPFVQSFFNTTFNTNGTCLGGETEFQLNSDVAVSSILWDFDDGTTSDLLSPTHVYAHPGIYSVTVETIIANQTITLTDEVVIFEVPVAYEASDYLLCENLSNSGFTNFDLTTKVSEIIGSQDGQNFTVLFFDSEADAINGTNPVDYNYGTSSSQTIYARIQNTFNSNCFDITSFELIILESPDIVENETLYFCLNESLVLTAESGFDSYVWSTGETTSSIEIDAAGTYTVDVIRSYPMAPEISCGKTKTFTIIPSEKASIVSVEIEEWSGRNGIKVVVEGLGDYEFSLDNINYQSNNYFDDLNYGDFVIYVRDKNGCGIVTEDVFILDYPKFFTPNSDDYNPLWQIKFPDTERDNIIFIYDRYGKKLKVLNATSQGWDGTYKGNLMPASDYWFVLKRLSKNKTYTGHFSLRR